MLILTFSGHGGQEKIRFLGEKISVILYRYLKTLVFFRLRLGVEFRMVCLKNAQKIGFNR